MNIGLLFGALVMFALGFAGGYMKEHRDETTDARLSRGVKIGVILMLVSVFIFAIFGGPPEEGL
jgi:Na+/H+ antiporter NhaC